MSQYYEMAEQTLWNPSNGASRLFLRQVALYEAELDLVSGIGPMEADECQIDPADFKAFVDALLVRHREINHAVVIALSEGFVATVLVLAERAGIAVDWNSTSNQPPSDHDAWSANLRGKSHELDRFMTR
ncbi:DUF6086 family protein [Streptomyces sp. NPDC048566]|uniref:DUF6086 family protein n=1 Tax=Streptomyces sp. NPDC048566 TaxID=3365569 RepID=UPI0037173289